MKNSTFDIIAIECFRFLVSEFGFTLINNKKENWGYELIYLNRTTGVKITYEYRESYIFIVLYRLVNGKLLKNSVNKNDPESSVLYGYSLDDIILTTNPNDLIKPLYDYDDTSEYFGKNGLKLYVAKFSDNLKKYGGDVLSGNFEIFSRLFTIVIERVKKYN